MRINDKLIVASVSVACAEEGVPRTIKDMAAVADEVDPRPHPLA